MAHRLIATQIGLIMVEKYQLTSNEATQENGHIMIVKLCMRDGRKSEQEMRSILSINRFKKHSENKFSRRFSFDVFLPQPRTSF